LYEGCGAGPATPPPASTPRPRSWAAGDGTYRMRAGRLRSTARRPKPTTQSPG